MAKVERYPRILATWGSLVALVALGEGRVAGEEKCRAAKGRGRLGSWDDSYSTVWGTADSEQRSGSTAQVKGLASGRQKNCLSWRCARRTQGGTKAGKYSDDKPGRRVSVWIIWEADAKWS